MIELQKACEIVALNNKGVFTCGGMELKDEYCFNVMPEVANSSVHLVNKESGEYRVVHFSLVTNEPIVQRYDKRDLSF